MGKNSVVAPGQPAKVENNAVHRLRFGIIRHIRMGIKVNLRPQSACGKQSLCAVHRFLLNIKSNDAPAGTDKFA